MPDEERRIIRFGEIFSSDELERDEIELELPEPGPEPPEEEQVEPWAHGGDKEHLFHGRLRHYRERFREHHGDQ